MGSFWDEWIIPHSVGVSSLLGCRFGRSGSSGVVGRFLRLRWGGYRGNRAVFTIAVELGDQLGNATVGIDFSKQQPYVAIGWGDLVEVVWKAETATPYVVEISCELRLAIVISNDAEQLSFKKGTTFVRKTMIY